MKTYRIVKPVYIDGRYMKSGHVTLPDSTVPNDGMVEVDGLPGEERDDHAQILRLEPDAALVEEHNNLKSANEGLQKELAQLKADHRALQREHAQIKKDFPEWRKKSTPQSRMPSAYGSALDRGPPYGGPKWSDPVKDFDAESGEPIEPGPYGRGPNSKDFDDSAMGQVRLDDEQRPATDTNPGAAAPPTEPYPYDAVTDTSPGAAANAESERMAKAAEDRAAENKKAADKLEADKKAAADRAAASA